MRKDSARGELAQLVAEAFPECEGAGGDVRDVCGGGEPLTIAASKAPAFKAGKTLRDAVRS